MLLHYSWGRDANDRSSQLQVQVQYNDYEPDSNIFVIAHYTRSVSMEVNQGFISRNQSIFKNIRFGVEAGAPIYEYYNGIQMNENLTLNFGVKYSI